jgi:hypothetical protein
VPSPRGSARRGDSGGVGGAVAALALYSGLLVWLTWPLATRIAAYLPDTSVADFDLLQTGWVLAYQAHRLATAPLRLLDANIYYPAHHSLFYGQTAFGALPVFAPVYLLTGNPTLALNLLFLGGVALTSWSIHLVLRHWTGSHLAGFVGAWTFLTNRWVLWEFVPTAPQYALLACFPPIVLLAARPTRRFAPMLLLFALVTAQALIDVVYLAGAVMLPLGLIALARLLRPGTRAAGLWLLGVLALAALVLLPIHLGHLAVHARNPQLSEQTFWTIPQNPIAFPWGLLAFSTPTAVTRPALVLIVAGAMLAWLRRPGSAASRHLWAHAALWALLGAVLSLKPVGDSPAHLALARWIPMLEVFRVPVRLGVAGLIGLVLLAGLAFAECLACLPDRRRGAALATRALLAAVVASALYADYALGVPDPRLARPALPAQYPIQATVASDTPLIRRLRQPGGPVLEMPVGERAADALYHARAMYRSIYHWRPLLNGYDGYWPAGFPERMALARRLPEPEALRALRQETGLDMILVDTAALNREKRAQWQAVAAQGGTTDLRLVAEDGGDLLFAVAPGRDPYVARSSP